MSSPTVKANGPAKLASTPITQGPKDAGLRLKLIGMISVMIGSTDLSNDSQPPLKGVGYNKNASDKKKGKKDKTRPDSLKLEIKDLDAQVKPAVQQSITKATRKEIGAFAQQELNKNPTTETCLPALDQADLKAMFPDGKLLPIQYKDAESDIIFPTVWRGDDKDYYMIKDEELHQLSQLPFPSKDDASVSVSVHCIELSVVIILELAADKKTLQAFPEYDTAKLALTDRKPEVKDMAAKAGFTFGGASGGAAAAAAAPTNSGAFHFVSDSESDAEDDDLSLPSATDASTMETVQEDDSEEAPAAKKSKRGSKNPDLARAYHRLDVTRTLDQFISSDLMEQVMMPLLQRHSITASLNAAREDAVKTLRHLYEIARQDYLLGLDMLRVPGPGGPVQLLLRQHFMQPTRFRGGAISLGSHATDVYLTEARALLDSLQLD